MKGWIRTSVFGDYGNLNTNNTDLYAKITDYLVTRGFKATVANEYRVRPDGGVDTMAMPLLYNEADGTVVEILSERINYQKNVEDAFLSIDVLNRAFRPGFHSTIIPFISEMGITGNRVALNIEVTCEGMAAEMPTVSTYFDANVRTEMSVRNVIRRMVGEEECNVILEQYVDLRQRHIRNLYDINTIAERNEIRFRGEDVGKFYIEFIRIAQEIEEGLKQNARSDS